MAKTKKKSDLAANLHRWLKQLAKRRESATNDRPGPLDRLEHLLQDLYTEVQLAANDAMTRFHTAKASAAEGLPSWDEYRWLQLLLSVSTALSSQLEAYEEMLRTFETAMTTKLVMLEAAQKAAEPTAT